ncbi:uncharacterized protein [Anoplolepis gracilipes]|uniref:uncharacterized protein n=1 Tax=Anoplolepis gracilipes TaxID=354296 RepID=UPI003BA04660
MYKTWLGLAKVTLTSTQVFNRRRAREIERVTIEDFNTREGITKEIYLDLYKSLGANLQQVADKYVRFLIRGKLGRTMPVILDMELVQCIELILKHRKDAMFLKKNPYVFGIPSSTKRYFKYLRACVLMRYFSKKCDAQLPTLQIPHSLRGTELRKHIATTCITLNLSENEVDDLANFMGHHEKIHKRHYRQSIPAIEIIRMTKFLEAALGENMQQQSNNSDSEEQVQDTNKATSNEESESDAETCISSASPYGLTKRRRWTDEERTAVIKEFLEEITSGKLPSNKKIFYVKEKNKYLINRSVAQIKTWLHNYISGKIKRY